MLRAVIDEVGELGDPSAGRPSDHYGALVRSIVGQQLSVFAARAIYGRLIDRFGGRPPTPQEMLVRPDGKMAYVSCDMSGKIVEIRTSDWGIEKTITAGKVADGLAWAAR